MLSLARELRGLTQIQLGSALDGSISQAKLSKIENGLIAPNERDVAALAEALGLRAEFFCLPHMRRAEPPTFHRKRKKLGKADWIKIYAKAEVYRISTAMLLRSLELAPKLTPPPAIDPDEHDGCVEEIATAVRQFWMLPRGRVDDLTGLLESAGVVVIQFDFGTDLCDGFSQAGVAGLPSVIFVNSRQPKDKLRFTLAHELGHLVMHRLPTPAMEDEANRFASEFLMPSRDIAKDFHGLSLEKFMALKLHWRVSMQSLIIKAHNAGKLTDSNYHYYMLQLSKKGWRLREPIEIKDVNEAPRILRQVIRSHLGPLQYSIDDVSGLLGLQPQEIEEFYGVTERARLRVVIK